MADVNEIYNEAEKLKDEGKNDEAIAKLMTLLESHPDHVLSHLALAVLYGKIGKHEEAVSHGQKACESWKRPCMLNPGNTSVVSEFETETIGNVRGAVLLAAQ